MSTTEQAVTVAQEAEAERVVELNCDAWRWGPFDSFSGTAEWGLAVRAAAAGIAHAAHRFEHIAGREAKDWRHSAYSRATFASLHSSPEPVPATNQAGEVECAPAYDFTMNGDLETVEAEPRTIEKDPFDWPGATGLFMGLFERRDQSEFKMHSGLWDVDGMSQNWPEVPNLRNRPALATQPATSQEGEADLRAALKSWRRAVELHIAKLDEGGDVTSSACRRSGQRCEATYRTLSHLAVEALPRLLAATPTPPTLSEDLREDTVAFVQEWMMSGDHAPDQWHRDFAAAIDARGPTEESIFEAIKNECGSDQAARAIAHAALACAQVRQ